MITRSRRTCCAYIHTCIHPCIHTYILTCMHPCIHAYMHGYMHICIQTFVHTHTHIRTHTQMHTQRHTYITHVHTYIHTQIHAQNTRTYIGGKKWSNYGGNKQTRQALRRHAHKARRATRTPKTRDFEARSCLATALSRLHLSSRCCFEIGCLHVMHVCMMHVCDFWGGQTVICLFVYLV